MGFVFGLLHCAAWNFHFPNPVERHLWRSSSIITSSVSIIYRLRMLWNLGLKPFQEGRRNTKDRSKTFNRLAEDVLLTIS